jgi:hypothetical protein
MSPSRSRVSFGLVSTIGLCTLGLCTLSLLVACGAPGVDHSGSGSSSGTGSKAGSDGEDGGAGSSTGSGSSSNGGVTGTGNSSNGGGGPGSGGASSGGSAPISSDVLPARIRRLTNAEYNSSVQALLGTSLTPSDSFPPDSRQQGYTVNEAQRIDPVLALGLDDAATALAAEAKSKFATLAPCQNPTAGASACADAFIESFGKKAYRRPLDGDDTAALKALYEAGASGGTYEDGIQLVIRGVLQSPGFLYLTEIGPGTPTSDVQMSPHEIASELAFLVTGGPPDQALSDLANGDTLLDPTVRETEARRLFATERGQLRAIQMVREWLALDRIVQTAKDGTVYPSFGDLRDDMDGETSGFIGMVLGSTGNVTELLGSTDSSQASSPLKAMYAQGGMERRGLLNQASFLSIFAHAQETAPVLRGVGVLKRVACQVMELPTNLNIQIVPPVPDPAKTTRERFSIHATDGVCAECHSQIDPLGFSFEQFDAMGAFRATENTIPIDSATKVQLGLDFDGSYANSNELAQALSTSATVRDCFGKQMFRANSAEGSDTLGYEAAFAQVVAGLPPDKQGNLLELLASFAKSELFVARRAQ